MLDASTATGAAFRALAMPRWRRRPQLRAYVAGVVLFLLLAPGLAVARQAAMLSAGAVVGAASGAVESYLLPLLPLDPVYAGAGLRVLGGIEPVGLALASPVGDTLHRTLPALFAAPDLVAPDAMVSALVAPGVTVLARLLAAVLATSVLVAGVGAVSRRTPFRALAVAVSLSQIWLLLDLAHEADFGVRDLETTGLPFALAAFAPVDAQGQRVLATTTLDAVPPAVVAGASAILTVAACLVLALLLQAALTRLGVGVARIRRQRQTGIHALQPDDANRVGSSNGASSPRRWTHLSRRAAARLSHLLVFSALALALSWSPYGALAEGEMTALSPTSAFADGAVTFTASGGDGPLALLAPAPEADQPVADATPSAPQAVAPDSPTPTPEARPAGSVVTLEGGNYQYVMRVDGKPTVVRGMGYNPWYASLPSDERQQLYRRDFSAMREIGVNTLEGWFQQQFDELTLDEAQRAGLKVIMPFELNQDYDYSDPAIQEMFRDQVTAWVLRYRDNPAVLMWGPGNEVMHRLIFPTVVQGQRDPAREKRADDFAAFYVQLVDMIHQLDPNHPVVYRDAEDLYFDRLRQALTRDGARRPWFVYGTNVYTQKLAAVIDRWPSQGVDAPLLVSEFSPGGVGTVDRPAMFSWYWRCIRAQPKRVLGGVVYTWTTKGPEDLDRVFGLTDEAGHPVDGSIDSLRQLFQGERIGLRRAE